MYAFDKIIVKMVIARYLICLSEQSQEDRRKKLLKFFQVEKYSILGGSRVPCFDFECL